MGHKLPFEREIRNLSKQKYPLVIRLPDVQGERYTEKKPCDFVAMNKHGNFIAVEAKAGRTDVFQFSQIPGHQRETLSVVAGTEYGKAYLPLNLRTDHGPGNAWWLPWRAWLEFEEKWHKKSIRREELLELFREYELVRITGGWKESEFVARLV
jgi:hypothetical protein